MADQEHTRHVRIVNELGLHARAAAKLVQLSSKFPVELKIGREDMGLTANAKSIMGVLMLAAAKGTDVTLTAIGEGEKATAALDAIAQLIESRFGEEK